tara:strand:+ start:2914 stop:3987 length:1074 start_codon:yes stop_codon:yes gene_type:complete
MIKPYVWATYTRVFYPKYMRGQIKYHLTNDETSNKIKKDVENFIYTVLKKLNNRNTVDGFVFGNVDYMEHQSWAGAAKRLDIPVVVLMCEGFFTKYWYERFINQDHFLNKTKFIYDKVFVPGNTSKNLAYEANIAEKKDIVVTGYPRTDTTFEILQKSMSIDFEKKNLIVLIAFNEPNYFSDNLWNEVLEKFINLCKDNKNLDFLIKTKKDTLTEEILERLTVEDKQMPNLKISHKIDIAEISNNLKVVISFASTFLIEMMSSEIPLLVPIWDDGMKSYSSGATYFDLENKSVTYTFSPNELDLEFYKLINGNVKKLSDDERNNLRLKRDKYIEPYLYKIDGKRTEFVSKEIIKLIK